MRAMGSWSCLKGTWAVHYEDPRSYADVDYNYSNQDLGQLHLALLVQYLPLTSQYVLYYELRLRWRCHLPQRPSHSLPFHHMGLQLLCRHLPDCRSSLTLHPSPGRRVRVRLLSPLPTFISYQLPAARQNILALGSSSPPDSSTFSPPASASLPRPVLDPNGKNMSALSSSIEKMAILIDECDVALSPGTRSLIVFFHISYRGCRLPHWHG